MQAGCQICTAADAWHRFVPVRHRRVACLKPQRTARQTGSGTIRFAFAFDYENEEGLFRGENVECAVGIHLHIQSGINLIGRNVKNPLITL